jgi:hypothetical protein
MFTVLHFCSSFRLGFIGFADALSSLVRRSTRTKLQSFARYAGVFYMPAVQTCSWAFLLAVSALGLMMLTHSVAT